MKLHISLVQVSVRLVLPVLLLTCLLRNYPVPNVTALPVLTTAMSRLSGSLSNLQATHSAHQSSLEAVNAERSQLDEKEKEMRDMVARAESKRAWFFDMKEWMETIATFLDEKVGAFLCNLPCECSPYLPLLVISCSSPS